jgi:hypothetical protein
MTVILLTSAFFWWLKHYETFYAAIALRSRHALIPIVMTKNMNPIRIDMLLTRPFGLGLLLHLAQQYCKACAKKASVKIHMV